MLKVRVNPKFSSNNISCDMSKSDKKKTLLHIMRGKPVEWKPDKIFC